MFKRRSKGYNGTECTSREIRDLLPSVLGQIGALHRDRPDLLLGAWPEIIGEKLAPMTQAIAFEKGIFFVKVSNSTLYSVLVQHEKTRLLLCLRKRFPCIEIKNIIFRLG